jgi:hypothetical protein
MAGLAPGGNPLYCAAVSIRILEIDKPDVVERFPAASQPVCITVENLYVAHLYPSFDKMAWAARMSATTS